MKILPFLLILFCSIMALGQTPVLSGTVVDAISREPLRNASIYNKAEKKGTRSDSLGRFVIPGAGKPALVISMIGYAPRTISSYSKDSNGLVIALTPEVKKLDEVVVTNKRDGKYRNRNN